ncbi:DNA polymerase III subunit beta [Roseomonas xinghualingensis]|uniref:DNA polymerase III subunit beta n=1 Tax=Roseomonas xinghualingensis TaxID=2986475 RepID=UPI0021F16661|nr:DNA polymerase III subunit beta [Roseomonas sp. SXEYE001]MCV4207543.1 DNA polymerase III subunit beta [Roseomonas sp. SXEYE001]
MPDGMGRVDDAVMLEHAASAPRKGAVVLAGHLLGAARIAKLCIPPQQWRKNQIPILANLLLQVKGGILTAQGTDLERCSAATAPAQGTLGPVTVAATVLVDLLARLPAEAEITLEEDRSLGRLIFRAPGLTAKMMALPAEDFPVWKSPGEGAVEFEIPVASLRRLLTLPAHAISTEETRYYLNGLYLHIATAPEAKLCAVATDGHRLALAEEDVPTGAERMPAVIVPRLAVSVLRGLLTQRVTGSVRITVTDALIAFAMSGWTLQAKPVAGTFPDYGRVVPHGDVATRRLKVPDPLGFARLLETAASISSERSRPVRLEKRTGDASLWIVTASPDQGEVELQMPHDVAAWDETSPEIVVGFQTRYLCALARAVPSGLTCLIQDASAPMRVEFPAGLAVLMPMRV